MHGMEDPKFTQLNNLASNKAGSCINFATDDWFASAENLIEDCEPVWKEGLFTSYGKWMDGWETRRKRIAGHDWCIIQLGSPGVIHGFDVDTSFFTGNFTPRVSIQAGTLSQRLPARNGEMGSAATKEQFDDVAGLGSETWTEILPMTKLRPGHRDTAHNYVEATTKGRWTHLRVNMFPDGGIARLRAYGCVERDWSKVSNEELIDLTSMLNGGLCVGYSDAHYGNPRNLIRPEPAENMGQGWETARKLDRPAVLTADENGVLKVPGTDWAEFKLGHKGVIKKIEIDTFHFKGNFPDSCYMEALVANSEQNVDMEARKWKPLLPVQKLSADQRHVYDHHVIHTLPPVSHVRLTIAPDGGISRMKIWGHVID